ncbi:MAG TPA: amidohydrolase family protein [Candidatus Thermoplasmatota archaeon]|nr:amidohydrolase family protein [Candidatus Thermoplasmatota archaeon]
MRVTDCHVHIQPLDMLLPDVARRYEAGRSDIPYVRELVADPRKFLAHMDREGVWRSALVNYPSPDLMGFTEKVNDFVAGYAKADPQRIVPFGGVHPRLARESRKEARRCVELGIRGFKVHPPHMVLAANDYLPERRAEHGQALREVYEVAQEAGLPVMIHTGTSVFPGARNRFADPMPIDDVAVDFPRLTILLAHGGRPLYMETAFFLLRRHRNVLLDVSSIPPRSLLSYFPRLDEIGDQVLFGSDWPGPGVRSMGQNLREILALPLSEEIKRKMVETNADRVFGGPR